MGKTSIEWTDETWNPVRGCTKVSPGCKHCYAETFAERWRGIEGHPYEQGFDLRLVPEKLDEPLRWKKPRRVFVNSMSDLFHKDVPNEYIAAVFGVMAACPQHTFQVLTKRAERLPDWFEWMDAQPYGDGAPGGGPLAAMGNALSCAEGIDPRFFGGEGDEGAALAEAMDVQWPLPNVWLGVSVEDQQHADARIPKLLGVPAAVRFLSCEPLLGPVDLRRIDATKAGWRSVNGFPEPTAISAFRDWQEKPMRALLKNGVDWVIVGGESGSGARPMQIAWAREILWDCRKAAVPVFVKQLGARPTMAEEAWRAGVPGKPGHLYVLNHRAHLKVPEGMVALAVEKKGGDWNCWPEDLRVREWPVTQ